MSKEAETLSGLLAAFMRRLSVTPENASALDGVSNKICAEIINLIRSGAAAKPVKVERRGRKPSHDLGWANACLLSMALESPDGLPFKQRILVDRLRGCFERSGRAIPGDSWLSQTVGAFYRSSNALAHDAIVRFRASADLQQLFQTEHEYVAWDRARIMLERQWHDNPSLQERYGTPQAYIIERLGLGN